MRIKQRLRRQAEMAMLTSSLNVSHVSAVKDLVRPSWLKALGAMVASQRRLALLALGLALTAIGSDFVAATRSTRGSGVARRASESFTLRYFDGRGVAETARMLFAVAQEDFEAQKRYRKGKSNAT